MEAAEIATLWIIFARIGEQWGVAKCCEMKASEFAHVVQRQIHLDANYEVYYRLAIEQYNLLLHDAGDNSEDALRLLYQQNQLPNPKYPDLAQFVILEFMRWQIAFGGFRAFAFQNYNGWMGGGSFLQVPPPYRALQNE